MISKNRKNVIFVSIIVSIFVGSIFVYSLNNATSTIESTQALPTSINIWITGDTQGDIQGESTDAGREGSIECLTYSHTIISPRDAASGLPTGKRQHKPITITKPIDKATPLMMNVLTNNEGLEVTFKFYRQTAVGSDEHYFTVELEGASIGSISYYSSSTAMGGEAAPPQAVITFYYTMITWTWEDGGITASDTWEAPDV